jgi:hypothetical protein
VFAWWLLPNRRSSVRVDMFRFCKRTRRLGTLPIQIKARTRRYSYHTELEAAQPALEYGPFDFRRASLTRALPDSPHVHMHHPKCWLRSSCFFLGPCCCFQRSCHVERVSLKCDSRLIASGHPQAKDCRRKHTQTILTTICPCAFSVTSTVVSALVARAHGSDSTSRTVPAAPLLSRPEPSALTSVARRRPVQCQHQLRVEM